MAVRPSDMTPAQRAQPPIPQATADLGVAFESLLLVLYLFLLTSRIFEFLYPLTGSLRLVLATSLAALLLALLRGGLFRAMKSWPFVLLVFLTGWMMLATPTSIWRGGSARMLRDVWSPSLLVFFVVAGLTATLGQVRKAFFAIGFGVIAAGLLVGLLGRFLAGRFAFFFGTFGNSNLLMFHLLFGAPMCLYRLQESGKFLRVSMIPALAVVVYTMLRTGSRGGLIILAVLLLMMLRRFSWFGRMLVAGVAAIMAAGLVLLPSEIQDRYRTMVATASDTADPAFQSALESRDARVVHLRESLQFTFEHPIFGVGPGLFSVASAGYAESEGRSAMWRETHNAYTQISSECGIPALLLFLGLLIWIWRTIARVDRGARAAGRRDIGNLAFCLKLSLAATAVHCLFDSIGYQYYVPLLAALTLALEGSTRALLAREAGARAGTPVKQSGVTAEPVHSRKWANSAVHRGSTAEFTSSAQPQSGAHGWRIY